MSDRTLAHPRRNSNTLIILNLDDPRVRDNLPDDHWFMDAQAIARGYEMERKFELARAGNLDLSDLEEL